jgi:hypothetical protein
MESFHHMSETLHENALGNMVSYATSPSSEERNNECYQLECYSSDLQLDLAALKSDQTADNTDVLGGCTALTDSQCPSSVL